MGSALEFFFVVISLVIALIALNRSTRTNRELENLREQIGVLSRDLVRLRGNSETESPEIVNETADDAADEAPVDAEPARPVPSTHKVEVPENTVLASASVPVADEPEAMPSSGATSSVTGESIEEAFTSRWMVWIGGATIALGGAYLVKFSFDQGWLSGPARVVLGTLLGLVLVVGAEWLRRRPLERAISAIRPDYVPAALAASGVSIAYASGFAAHALYDLLNPLTAFLYLSLLSVGAILMALLQGPFVAVLGLLGSLALPVLVSTDEPSALGLFSFLLVISSAALAVSALRGWRWLAWMALSGGGLWAAVWIGALWSVEEQWIVGLFILLLMALCFAVLVFDMSDEDAAAAPASRLLPSIQSFEAVVWGGTLLAGGLALFLLQRDVYETVSIAIWMLYGVSVIVGAYLVPRATGAVIIAPIVTAAALAIWGLPQADPQAADVLVPDFEAWKILPAAVDAFTRSAALFGLFFGLAGYVIQRNEAPEARSGGVWASISAIAPVVIMGIAYWRVRNFDVSIAWGAAGILLAGILVYAVTEAVRKKSSDAVVGAYTIGAVMALTLAFAMSFERAFLTVAIALQVPLLAWTHARFNLPILRPIVGFVAALVVTRLALNPFILDYDVGTTPIFNWILYAYGIPALGFWYATNIFRREGDGHPVPLLSGGAIVFFVLLVSLQIRHFVTGGLDTGDYTLAEASLHTISWLATSAALFAYGRDGGFAVHRWISRLLLLAAYLQLVLIHFLFLNPVFTGDSVGSWPVLNVLLLAYAIPGLLAGLHFCIASGGEPARRARVLGVTALVLVFAYISFEVRRAFHGADLTGDVSTAEMYSYSLAWLLFAIGLIAAAIRFESKSLRYAGLAVVMIAIAKVFAVDMSNLEGLWRVLSLIGLGFTLIGIPYLYQRYVFPPSSNVQPAE